jgi:choline-glycine betaine transporter
VIDVLLWAVVVPIMFVRFLLTIGSAFANHLMVGWALALGVVAYGNPVWAFWSFVAWLAAVWLYRRRLTVRRGS